jgi:DNA-binding LacI/PurR family transcriptional regulator
VVETEQVDVESGARLVDEILQEMPDVDGIACAGDPLAIGIIKELRQRGKRVPEDVQVVGFDDQPLMDALGLTTIRQPMAAFGDWAAQTILSLIESGGAEKPESLVLPLEVIERDTTR